MSPAEHELLSRTGPGTVMGKFLRRYWTAALLSRNVASRTEAVADAIAARPETFRPSV